MLPARYPAKMRIASVSATGMPYASIQSVDDAPVEIVEEGVDVATPRSV
jgi:hypothetical protein